MRRTIVRFLLAVMSVAAPASAGEQSWYLAIEGGLEFGPDAQYARAEDTGVAVLGAVGGPIGSGFVLEGELGYRHTSLEFVDLCCGVVEADVAQFTMMANALYNVPLGESVSLSFGVGAGLNNVGIFTDFFDDTSVEAAAQAKAGLSVAVSEGTDVIANFRYLATFAGDGSYRDVDDATVTVGVKFDR